MLNVRIGPAKMPRPNIFKFWKFIVAALVVASVSTFLIQKYSDLLDVVTPKKATVANEFMRERKPVSLCPTTICPDDQYSFFVHSGAANVIPPKICFMNQLILGSARNNFGVGINAVTINGKTGEVIHIGHYDMYGGDVNPFIHFLKNLEIGSIVLMASFDEPSSKLNEEARKLILDLGSSMIKTVGFRDNWIFVGGKGATVQSTFEKHLKNDFAKNKYKDWPEIIDISGCIPKYIENAQDQSQVKQQGPEENRL